MPLERVYLKKGFSEVVHDLLTDIASGLGGQPALTDVNEGSVVRTLAEAFARELAVCYEQLDSVYRNAYLDSASGPALDNVVALLGLDRQRGGHLEGTALFSRGQPAPEDIHIPLGTLVAGRDVPLFATTANAVLDKGERQVVVGVRAVEPGGKKVKAGALASLPRPIAGIDRVSNPGELVLRQREETDDELRARARRLVLSSNTGTVAALEEAARSLGIREVQVIENPGGRPGEVEVVLGDRDIGSELLEEVRNRLENVRPAGIVLRCGPATPVFVQITATLTLNAVFSEREQADILKRLRAVLTDYFGALKVGEAVRDAKIRALLLSHEAVVGCERSDQRPILEPFVCKDGSGLESVACAQMGNGDVMPGPSERIGLHPEALPLRLSLEPPKPNLWVDTTLSVAAGTPTGGLQARITGAIKDAFDKAAGKASAEAPASLGYTALREAVTNIVPPAAVVRLRVTVTHERDGLVEELDDDSDLATVGAREQPMPRKLTLRVEGSDD
ncbi:baseplate J/gp47 family protein [Zoogloea sp.]|uniref:baseplate J/gp47 family protein n=1 Tax=Zoogloea sp. TaxID=49181 RepID=UPI0035B45ECA